MKRLIRSSAVAVLAALLAVVSPPRAQAQSHGKAWENVILDNKTGYWRVFYMWRTPRLISDAGEKKTLRERFDARRHKTDADRKPVATVTSKRPPKKWYAPSFDHAAWPRQHGVYGPAETRNAEIWDSANPTELALICLRGEFEVIDAKAIKDLQLSLEYHGGVAVYINGKEIKRAHIREGKIKSTTYAEPYPKNAYTKADFTTPQRERVRTLRVLIEPKHVKKGKNIIAVALHRAPINEILDQVRVKRFVPVPLWSHAFVRRALLHSAWGLTPRTVVRSSDEPMAVKKRPGRDVLNNRTGYWRTFTRYKTVELVSEEGKPIPLRASPTRGRAYEEGAERPVFSTPCPPADWIKPEFDDSEWARYRGVIGPGWGHRSSLWSAGNPAALSLLCARGKVWVEDPKKAKDLQVAVDYYGGVVVYVNGVEIARKHLPGGKITADTLATPYQKPAYLKPDGKLLHPIDAAGFHDHIKEYRLRTLKVTVPRNVIRNGRNVVAIEIHRAPTNLVLVTGKYHRRVYRGPPGPWPHAVILRAAVRALLEPAEFEQENVALGVTPNLARPEGVQVWNSRAVRRILHEDYGNPCETLHAIRIVGARGGSFCGQVAFGCTDPVEEMKATVSDLKAPAGIIPASAVEVSYLKSDSNSYAWGNSGRMVTPWPDPPAVLQPQLKWRGMVQPIWLKIRVPRDAKPGEYTATLTIAYKRGIRDINLKAQKPIHVPIRLRVHDWTLPKPQEYRTFIDLIQSPESVAMMYKVPQWSKAHWKYMEESFKLLAEIGNKSVYLPLITRTHFGNSESILRYVKQKDGSYKPDFTIVDRYMDLVERTQGKPTVIVLYLWERYTCPPRRGPAVSEKYPLVTEVDPATGTVKEIEVPKFNTPEGKAFWGPVIKAIRRNMARRGLENTLMLGIHGDWTRIPPGSAKFFTEIAPGVPWVDQSHGLLSSVKVDRKVRVPVGYATTVWNARGPHDPRYKYSRYGQRNYGWRSERLVCQFHRDLRRDHRSLHSYRSSTEWNITGHQRGQGRFGGDFWNVLKRGDKEITDSRHAGGRTIIHRYPHHSSWYQLVVRTSFLASGKNGAIPSVHFAAMREGVQNCEARIFIEKILLDTGLRGKLGEALAARAQKVLDERTWIMAHCSRDAAWFFGTGFTERQNKLYGVAADVAKALAKE